MTGQTLSFGTNDPDKIVSDTNGIAAGTANAKVFLTVKSALVVGTTTLFYGSVPGTGNNFAVTSGAASQGDYGYGGLVDIVVSEAGVITKYRLGTRITYSGVLSAYGVARLESLRRWITYTKPDYVLVHSIVPDMTQYFGGFIESNRSYLFMKKPNGWIEKNSWEHSQE